MRIHDVGLARKNNPACFKSVSWIRDGTKGSVDAPVITMNTRMTILNMLRAYV